MKLNGQLGNATQNGPYITGFGYALPTPVDLAPGEILTLMVNGTELPMSGGEVIAAPAGANLPTTLAGISFTYGPTATSPLTFPILAIQAFYGCGDQMLGKAFCTPFGAVTVQVPFEIQICAPCSQVLASLQNGVGTLSMDVQAYPDQVHILTSCDSFLV